MKFGIKTGLILSVALCCAASERLELIRAGRAEFVTLNNRKIHKLEQQVHFRQGDAYLRCEKAFFDVEADRADLYDQVEIYDGKHRLFGDRVIYETQQKTERAAGNVRLIQEGRILQADSVVYQQEIRQANAFGNVTMTDVIENVTLTAQKVFYDRLKDYGVAWGSPEVIQQDTTSEDSLIISGNKMEVWGGEQKAIITDTVIIRKADLKAVSNRAVFYSDTENLLLYESPEMVEQNRVIRGDSMHIQLSDSDFKGGQVFGKASIVSVDSVFEDVLNGDMITMNAENDSVRTVVVDRQAENVYHIFNDDQELEGVNEIDGDRIVMKFSGKKLTYVRVESTPGESRGKFIPAGYQRGRSE